MKTIANLLAVAIILITTSSLAIAQKQRQQGPPPLPNEEKIEEMVDELAKELSLSDDQKSKVLVKYKAHFEDVEAVMEKGRPDRKEMESLKKEFEDDVKSVLDDDQKESFTEFQKEKRPKR